MRDAETGEVSLIDRIVLAWIPPEQFTFSGYPVSLRNQNTVSYFYPGDEIQGNPIHHGASIYQGGLEELSHDVMVWEGYIGDFSGNSASLNLISGSNGETGMVKEIHFNGDLSATITYECPGSAQICVGLGALQDKQLSKVY